MKTIKKLYRLVSSLENEDYTNTQQIRCLDTTLQVKEFFLKKTEALQYAQLADVADFDPPYTYIWEIILIDNFKSSEVLDFLTLDTFKAAIIDENDLNYFNNCIKLVKQNER